MSEETNEPMARDLEHHGSVFDHSEPGRIANQPNAQNVVVEAMERSEWGSGVVRWYPDPTETVYSDTIEIFRQRIWEGVSGIVNGYALDDERYDVEVKYASGRCFEVFIFRVDRPKGFA